MAIPRAGQMLSHYRLVEKIGEGGMGIVWKAEDTVLSRTVAIKVLPADKSRDENRRQMFLDEAKAASSISDARIVQVYEFGHQGDLDFIVMEYVEGAPLSKVLLGRPMSPDKVADIGLQVARALAKAHRKGLIHRDLKPANILVTPEGEVKVVDFGLATLFEYRDSTLAADVRMDATTVTQEHRAIAGTVPYMSPEQVRGEKLDHRSDIFSLGTVLYEMTTGQRPFKGHTNVEVAVEISKSRPRAVHELVPTVPMDLHKSIQKSLSARPGERYQHMDDLAVDLRRLREEIKSGSSASYAAVQGEVIGTDRRRTSRWVLAVTTGVLVLVAAILGFLRLRSPTVVIGDDFSIAVMGFENVTDPDDMDRLSRALMGLVTTDLAESGGLDVVSTAKVLASLKRVGATTTGRFDAVFALDAARQAGAQVMLVGQVTQAADRLLLTAELVDVERGNTLGSLKREADSTAELFTLAGAIATEVREQLGVSLQEVNEDSFDLARALTSSLDAYRHYASGEIALHEYRWDLAIQEFDDAIGEDPTFALAHYRRAIALSWKGSNELALASLELGRQHASRLPNHWQVTYESLHDYLQGEAEAAYESLMPLTRSSPETPDAHFILGEILTHFSRYYDPIKARQHFERALEIDPTFRVVLIHLIESYLLGGHYDKAHQLLDRFRKRDPDVVAIPELSVLMAEGNVQEAIARGEALVRAGQEASLWLDAAHMLAGDWEAAHRSADEATRSGSGWSLIYAYARRGYAAIGRGHLQAGMADLRRAAEDQLRVLGSESGQWASAWHLSRAQVLEMAGDLDGALRSVQEAMAVDRFYCRSHFYKGRFLLAVDRHGEANLVLDQLRNLNDEITTPACRFWTILLQADLFLAAGNDHAATLELDKLTGIDPEYRDGLMEQVSRSRVKAAAGDLDGAVEALRGMLERPLFVPVALAYSPVVEETRTLYDLAVLEEEARDEVSARQHYREYLDRWGNADIPIPAVGDAKARLAALEARSR